MRASATTANVNGAGFNIANANFPTDLTTDANTANTASPVVSSATYTFVAGDANAWLYIASGTNWTPGWYQIASVAGGKATLSAAVGAAIQRDTSLFPIKYSANTVAGCATVGTPTGGTFGIDYSQQDTAQATNTNLTCTAASTTVTSASAPFTRMMVGNIIHLTALTGTGAIIGWYEVVNYTDTSNIVLDRTPTNGVNNITAGTFYVGGAGRWNALEDAFLEMLPASSYVWTKSGSYTLSGAVSVSSTNAGISTQTFITGYTTLRGDTCNGSSRPVLTAAANAFAPGQYQNFENFSGTTTSSAGFDFGLGITLKNCKFTNTSTTADRAAITLSSTSFAVGVEAVSQNGVAISTGTARLSGCYLHDSKRGWSSGSSQCIGEFLIIANCLTDGILMSSSTCFVQLDNVTIHGNAAKQCGTGLNISNSGATLNRMRNCVVDGWTTGVSVNTSSQSNRSDYNDYYNNTTDVTNFPKASSDLAVDPSYTDVAEITGSTATTSGSVLTQSGGDFSTVEDNVDYLHVISGTGVTTGRYLITSHTSTTVTVNNALGTSSGGDVVYFIPTGHDFTPGTNLKSVGFPGAFPGAFVTGHLDIGAIQRIEGSGESGGNVIGS